MKKLLLIIGVLFVSITAKAQFVLTPMGVVATADSSKNYVIVDVPTKNQADIFKDISIKLNKKYNHPSFTISKVEPQSIQISGIQPNFCQQNGLQHTINIEIKDNRFKFTVISMELPHPDGHHHIVLINKFYMSGIFNKNGKVRLGSVKRDVESFFNDYVKTLSADYKTDDNW